MRAPDADTVYHWAAGRGHEHLLDIIPETFKGMVQCDAYGAYRTMLRKRPGVELAGCWAHVRRKFHEAFVQREVTVRSGWILRQIGHPYAIERKLRESRAGPDLRAAIRSAESRPILTRLKRLLTNLQPATQAPAAIADRQRHRLCLGAMGTAGRLRGKGPAGD